MDLKDYIKRQKTKKELLMMTHQVLGYPSFEVNEKMIDTFYNNQIDLIELQIPFSEPIADGPLFLRANQMAIQNGVTVKKCLDFVERMVQKYKDLPFLIMTYYNIVFQAGSKAFLKKCKEIGCKGLIVPDAPIDDARDFFIMGKELKLDIIGLTTAFTKSERLIEISKMSGGFLYYVPRKGVTGEKTTFDTEALEKIKEVKKLTHQPIAVGFGIAEKNDLEMLTGNADIAIIGSKILKVYEEEGVEGVDLFLKNLKTGSELFK